MTAAAPSALAGVRFLPDVVAESLGVAVGDVVGRPLSLAFHVRPEAGRGLYVSGLEADAAQTAVQALGGRLVVVGTEATPGAELLVATELWSGPGPGAVGTGPVALTADGPGAPGTARWCTIEKGHQPDQDRLGAVTALRQELGRAADRLEAQVAPPVDWSVLTTLDETSLEWLRLAFDHVARSRRAVGAYLIDVADEIDDERLDQLGDGYVRSSDLWRELARVRKGEQLGDEVHDLERSCVTWMRGAANPPTRYAF